MRVQDLVSGMRVMYAEHIHTYTFRLGFRVWVGFRVKGLGVRV